MDMTVQIQLRSVDQFVDISHRWNSNDEIASVLLSAQSHSDWLQAEVELRPPSGKLVLYRRKDGSYYKQDGYSWKKRKDGKLAREDHMKLKVMGVELIHANYVHSAFVPTFHRRAYWMLTNPEIILVHYLNASYEEPATDCRPLADRIVSCLRSNCADMSPHEILIQLTPMLSNTFSPSELDRLCRMAEKPPGAIDSPAAGTMVIQMVASGVNNDTQPLVLSVHSAQLVANSFQPKISSFLQQNNPHELSMNRSIVANNNAVLEIASEVASTLHSPLCRSSSCSSASRRGLSSLAMRRQPSTFSDSVGQELCGGILNEYVSQSNASDCCGGATMQQAEPDDSAYCSFSGDQRVSTDMTVAQTPPVPNAEQYRQPATERSRTDSFGSNRVSLWETSSNTSNLPLVEITDFSPEWSYPEGGVKILVSGPWYLRGHEYSAVFDGLSVPAVLIQAGVLRCFCPAHSPASVQLSIACDGQIISTSAAFTYLDRVHHAKQSSSSQNAIDGIVSRLETLERFLNINESASTAAMQPKQPSSSHTLESRFVAICERMKSCRWKQEQQTWMAPIGSTLLHYAAILGFDRLIEAVLRWRAENPPPVNVRDFDVLGRDANGRTPLHLSALNGHVRCVTLIARVCPHAVDVVDDRGETAAELAVKNGQKRIATLISQLVRRRGGDHVDSTTLWVMTNGETVTDKQRLESISSKPPMVPRRGHVFRHQQTIDTPENMRKQTGTRERTKRASVECLEELLMDSSEDRESSFAPPDDVSSLDDDDLSDLQSESWLKEPLSVDIPMDVHVPDSPKTAQMWEAVTSPGMVANDGARARIASLAQQIIDALPQRIKENVAHQSSTDRQISTDFSDQSPSGLSGHSKNPFLPSANAGVGSSADWEDLNMLMSPLGGDLNHFRFVGSDGATNSNDPLDVFSPPLVTNASFGADGQSIGRSVDSLPPVVGDPAASAKDLGEFFNADDSRNSPLDRHFQDLRLSGEPSTLERVVVSDEGWWEYRRRRLR
uniref:CG-1 domain-containing protein n=1 Tax=Plectus sambesii TaxID=2011161 RepID=A0A914WWG3_9BILA